MHGCLNSKFEPTVIHIRPGASSDDLRKEITEKLSEEHGFINLDVNALIRDENERKTEIIFTGNTPKAPRFPAIVIKMMCLSLIITLLAIVWITSFMMNGRCTPELLDFDRHNGTLVDKSHWLQGCRQKFLGANGFSMPSLMTL